MRRLDINCKSLYLKGMSATQIAKKLKCSKGAVLGNLRRNGLREVLKSRRQKVISKEPITELHPEVFPDPNTGCWLWNGVVSNWGYGIVRQGKKNISAHRLSYQQRNGPIPKELYACHKCDTKACVNPDHLFLGTAKDNAHDCIRKNRNAKGERQGSSKLTKEDVIKIRELLAQGMAQTKIAKLFKINQPHVSTIKLNKGWAWLK